MIAAWSAELLVDRASFTLGFIVCLIVVGAIVAAALAVAWFIYGEPSPLPEPRLRRRFDVRHANDFEAWEDELR